MNFLEKIKARLGVSLLVLAFLASLIRVLTLQSHEDSTGQVIRIVHWQMEADVSDALNHVGDEYHKLHPDVRIEQILISERGYISWVTTRLIGGTAPDIISVPDEQLYQRYFLPLSAEIEKPNPYNKGTALEGVPWKKTYYDSMNGGFVTNLVEYYTVPSSAFTSRLFYNKKLFKAATGLDSPPKNFHAFMEACEKITAYGNENHRQIVPIAGAGKYNAKPLWERFDIAVGSTLAKSSDLNRDGITSEQESAIALVSGDVKFDDPRIEAMFKGRDYYNKQFQTGFFGADRMDAAFLFLQQRAVMIASGSWDAGSYVKQADFEIGICDFPLPGLDDPEFGKFVEGPATEELKGGFSFSINRMSPHRETALDFLRFLSSQKINDELNRRIKWIPMIKGNRPDPFIAPFWPQIDGVRSGITLGPGDQNTLKFDGLLSLYSTGRLTFPEFVEQYKADFVKNSDLFILIDLPRKSQLALSQAEFIKTYERTTDPTGTSPTGKYMIYFEGQTSRHYETLETTHRYEEAREHTPLPKP